MSSLCTESVGTCLSTAWRCGDGALKIVKWIGSRMNRDGNREIEDSCSGCSSVQCRHSWASSLCWAIWSKDLGLKLQQLAHEAKVRGDDASSLFHKLKGFIEFDLVGPHKISKTNGGRAGDSGLAVDKHSSAIVFDGICNNEENIKLSTSFSKMLWPEGRIFPSTLIFSWEGRPRHKGRQQW